MGSLPQWARDAYLRPWRADDYFDDAGGDHHLFARVLDLEGNPVKTPDLIIGWSDGFNLLGQPNFEQYITMRMTPKEKSGWANQPVWNKFYPDDGQRGAWCWYPRGSSDVVREVISRFDTPGKPLFLSEIGWQNPDDRQAACMEVGLGCTLDDPAVALCFWYGMQDDAAESYGLYRKEGLTPDQRKPIYDRFVTLATNPRTVPAARVRRKAPAARFVTELDSVPDDSVLAPGVGFAKIWRLQNTGATTWGEGYQFVLVAGQTLGAPHRMPVPHCPPGQSVDIRVSFMTPPEAGQYISTWSLADPRGNLFGDQVWARILVAPLPVAAPMPAAPRAAAMPAPVAPPALPVPEAAPVTSPLVATALGIIYQTSWLRVWAAAVEPNPQQAMHAFATALSMWREGRATNRALRPLTSTSARHSPPTCSIDRHGQGMSSCCRPTVIGALWGNFK